MKGKRYQIKPRFTMTSRTPEGQNDFLDAAALQKLIVSAMKSATDKNPQALVTLLHQISNRYNSANSYVRSEVAELMQELKNLVGDFETSPPAEQSVPSVPIRSNAKNRFVAFAFAGFAAIVTLSTIAVASIRHSTAIAPSQPTSSSTESKTDSALICGEVNPSRVMVKGHSRSNGSYVKPHERTAPNQTKADNLNCSR